MYEAVNLLEHLDIIWLQTSHWLFEVVRLEPDGGLTGDQKAGCVTRPITGTQKRK